MKIKKSQLISCPHCGYQYLPKEIYLPNFFFGETKEVSRDTNGRIVDIDKPILNLTESYICDKCSTKFNVTAKILFQCDTNENDFFDDTDAFSEVYSSKIDPQQIKEMFLEE